MNASTDGVCVVVFCCRQVQVWQATLRGLYERHQFLFTLLMTLKIEMHAGRIR